MTKDYVDGIFERLSGMRVELDANPLEFGPGVLNEKTAKTRSMLSDTETVFMEVSHNLHKFKRDLLREESALKIAMTRLMAEDPHVRSGRSQQEREALALLRLTDHSERIDGIRLKVADLEELMKIIKAKRTDLKDIQGRLRDQLKLCQEQLALGERWGNHARKQSEIIHTTPAPSADTDFDLDQVFAEAMGRNNGKSKDDPLEGINTSEAVDSFLETDLVEPVFDPFKEDQGILMVDDILDGVLGDD